MKRCPNNDRAPASIETDYYCYRCGSELVKVPGCSCGRMLTPADVFCPRCGKKVEG